jgi:hypothetical protein
VLKNKPPSHQGTKTHEVRKKEGRRNVTAESAEVAEKFAEKKEGERRERDC